MQIQPRCYNFYSSGIGFWIKQLSKTFDLKGGTLDICGDASIFYVSICMPGPGWAWALMAGKRNTRRMRWFFKYLKRAKVD